MTQALKQAVDVLDARRVFAMPAAKINAVQAVNLLLSQKGFTRIPADYAKFLALANGMQTSAFTLYGTDPMPMAGGFMEKDLLSATVQAMAKGVIPTTSVVIGRSGAGALLAYDSIGGKYLSLDETLGDVFDEFADIAALIRALGKPLAAANG